MAERVQQSDTPPENELEDYLREIKDIQQGKEAKESGSQSHDEGTDDELSKTPDGTIFFFCFSRFTIRVVCE